MQRLLTLIRSRYAVQVLQSILEVVVNQNLRLGANSELVIDGANSGHFGFGIGHGLADVVAEYGLLFRIGLGLGRKQEEGFLIGDDVAAHALAEGGGVAVHVEQVVAQLEGQANVGTTLAEVLSIIFGSAG